MSTPAATTNLLAHLDDLDASALRRPLVAHLTCRKLGLPYPFPRRCVDYARMNRADLQ